MPIPEVNVEIAAEGNIGVLSALTVIKQSMGNAVTAYFLDVVPERGVKLWGRFRAFQAEHADTGFDDFVKSVMTADPVALFYPKGCTLDGMTRGLLVSLIQNALQGKIATNEDVLKIHFAEGAPYAAVRSVACKGCPMTKCQHWVAPQFAQRSARRR